MNQAIKQRWIEALPSYQQTRGTLHDGTGFCCLGVLCDLYAKEKNEEWVQGEVDENFYFQGRATVLPLSVMSWAGLKADNPEVRVVDDETCSRYYSLAELNDSGKTFSEIAQIIEEQL